ncbi:MAG: hypothetical protein UY18_C0050G0008 [Microgenomates group bacterium GW2011_GWF2_47_9]|nr:MAG: hypothetical protein UY18_C0050G0008 [Microgenomates group bacterium GW2011_GWF2_47_9]
MGRDGPRKESHEGVSAAMALMCVAAAIQGAPVNLIIILLFYLALTLALGFYRSTP